MKRKSSRICGRNTTHAADAGDHAARSRGPRSEPGRQRARDAVLRRPAERRPRSGRSPDRPRRTATGTRAPITTRKIAKPSAGCSSTRSTRSVSVVGARCRLAQEAGRMRASIQRVAPADDLGRRCRAWPRGQRAGGARPCARSVGRHVRELVALVEREQGPQRQRAPPPVRAAASRPRARASPRARTSASSVGVVGDPARPGRAAFGCASTLPARARARRTPGAGMSREIGHHRHAERAREAPRRRPAGRARPACRSC